MKLFYEIFLEKLFSDKSLSIEMQEFLSWLTFLYSRKMDLRIVLTLFLTRRNVHLQHEEILNVRSISICRHCGSENAKHPRGRFHQTLCTKQKVAGAQHLAKNSLFNFTNVLPKAALVKFTKDVR